MKRHRVWAGVGLWIFALLAFGAGGAGLAHYSANQQALAYQQQENPAAGQSATVHAASEVSDLLGASNASAEDRLGPGVAPAAPIPGMQRVEIGLPTVRDGTGIVCCNTQSWPAQGPTNYWIGGFQLGYQGACGRIVVPAVAGGPVCPAAHNRWVAGNGGQWVNNVPGDPSKGAHFFSYADPGYTR